MNDITLQEAAHKNVILWRLMDKLHFWKVKTKYDINRKAVVISLGKFHNNEIGHFCKQFSFDRLKYIDKNGDAHIYEFTDNTSYMWLMGEFNFFPVESRKHVVFAKAELLDHLIEDFPFGIKWKKEYMMVDRFEEIAQTCIDIDLNFNDKDMLMEKSLIECVELAHNLKSRN